MTRLVLTWVAVGGLLLVAQTVVEPSVGLTAVVCVTYLVGFLDGNER